MNKQLANRRSEFEDAQRRHDIQYWLKVAKSEAVRTADFWEKKMNEHRSILDEIIRAIDERSIQRRRQ